jgi:antitoxin component of MazEF toxin-antitoxin module
MKIQVGKFKEQFGVLLPDELVASLGSEPGDILQVEVENGGLKIVRIEKAFDHCMRIVEQAMDDYRETLQALAKE